MRLKLFKTLLVICLGLISACTPNPASLATEQAATPQATPSTLSSPAATRPAATPDLPPGQVHPAALAGSWYPADPDQLTGMVDGFLAAVEPMDGDPLALVVPHAGYTYSGQTAAYGFKQLEGKDYDVAIIIASDHQAPLSNPISVWAEGSFETPLGAVAVDVDLAQALVKADPRITSDLAAYNDEHPIEIELPFLQRVCPACRIVPVLMASERDEDIQALAQALLSVLDDEQHAVVIASSDLSHYPSREDARQVDSATLSAIETGDPAGLASTLQALMAAGVPNLVTCACGAAPIQVAMRVAQGRGANIVSILDYANSADSPQGDAARAVGYGAVMLWRYTEPDLTEEQRAELLRLARTTLEAHLKTGRAPDYTPSDPLLARRAGAFVTLKQAGELRGCIGHMRPDVPLYQTVQNMAISAATADPRFPPLPADELGQTEIEISVLSPMRRLTDVQHIEVGVHGLMIFKGQRQGVFLPQVPVEQGWGRDEYLENLCGKAGLPAGCWKENATLYTFTAVVFGEHN